MVDLLKVSSRKLMRLSRRRRRTTNLMRINLLINRFQRSWRWSLERMGLEVEEVDRPFLDRRLYEGVTFVEWYDLAVESEK